MLHTGRAKSSNSLWAVSFSSDTLIGVTTKVLSSTVPAERHIEPAVLMTK